MAVRRNWAPWLGLLCGLLAVVGLGCHLFADSRLPAAAGAPQVGSPAPAFAVLDQNGAALELAGLRGRNLVLVFYRGFW